MLCITLRDNFSNHDGYNPLCVESISRLRGYLGSHGPVDSITISGEMCSRHIISVVSDSMLCDVHHDSACL